MGSPAASSNLEVLRSYLASNTIFIVDPSSASRRRLARTLVELGANQHSIHLHGDFETAQAELRRLKPRVVIADYTLGARSGLDLLQTQREEFPDTRECLFVLVTANASQSTVAKAVEEDVDGFIIKPYTMKQLVTTLAATTIEKMNPSSYRKAIEAGRQLLLQGKPVEASVYFEQAISLDPAPSLAYSYLGQAKMMKQALSEAKTDFEKGLTFNKIHYRCLVGLHDLFLKQGQNEEAYAIVKQIASVFPANPKRMASVIRLAVVTHQFSDIEYFYEIFKKLEERDEELVRYVCVGLIVAGKHFAGRGMREQATKMLEGAAISCAGQTQILRQVTETAIELDYPEVAESALKRFPPAETKSPDFLISAYLVMDQRAPLSRSIETGRALLKAGIQWPSCLATLIRRLTQAGNLSEAEFLLGTFQAKWKDSQPKLEQALVAEVEELRQSKAASRN